MTIAAHIHSQHINDLETNFNFQTLALLAAEYPDHHFIFIFDSPFDTEMIRCKNITPVLLGPSIKNNLLLHYWYNYKIPRLLLKYNADIFLSAGMYCSLRTEVKQCIFIPDLTFLKKNKLNSSADERYLRRFYKRFITKAGSIIMWNDFLQKKICEIYLPAIAKIGVINNNSGFPDKQFDPDINQLTRQQYAEDKEYFVCFVTDASIGNTVLTLKAFSAFKKLQLSNMKLIFAVSKMNVEAINKDLINYKYRTEVKIVLCDDINTANRITAAAYASLYLPSEERMENKWLLSIKNEIPIITVDTDFAKAICGEAALYTLLEEKKIAEKMMNLYKDENLRKSIMHQASLKAANISPAITAAALWKVMTITEVQNS
ncbi:MAG: hypothetical protein ABIO04_06495 [Ferruginibacter sp.]